MHKSRIVLAALACVLFLMPFSNAYADENESGEPVSQQEYKENSWRYKDGERIDTSSDSTYRTTINVWGYEDGYYINSNGEPIEGALSKGIDVSSHNGRIDWEKIKTETDIEYVIIRCGYGNDMEEQDDDYWTYNVSECTRLGIPFGVYIYSYALDTKEALSEAEHVLRLIDGYNLTYPVYLDLEDEQYTGKLTNQEIAAIAQVFCQRIEEAGYDVGTYANLYWYRNRLTGVCFNQWERWVAQYNYECNYEGSYGMWQCALDGIVDGINGYVDINFDFIQRSIDDIELSAVSDLTAWTEGMSKIGLSWNKVSHAEGYHIYRKKANETKFSYYATTKATSFVDEQADNDSYTFYRVYPYHTNSMGIQIQGPSESYVFAKGGLKAVENISATANGRNSVYLYWQKVEGADGYIIYKATGDGKFSYLYIKENNTYIDNKASATEYNYYRIYPYYMNEKNERIVGPSKKYAYAKGILPAVTGLKAQSAKNVVTVKWDKVQGADGYIIYRQVGNTGKFTYRYMVSGNSFNDTTASQTEYNYYRVYPYFMLEGSRITTTQSVAYVYGKAK